MKRKIVQIAANDYGVFALADDGTFWQIAATKDWQQLPPLPDADEEEDR